MTIEMQTAELVAAIGALLAGQAGQYGLIRVRLKRLEGRIDTLEETVRNGASS